MYRKVRIRKHYFEDLPEHRNIILAYQLSRLSNALTTWMRVQVTVYRSRRRTGKLLAFKTRFDVTVQHAAILYEVTRSFLNLSKDLPRFRVASFDLFLIDRLRDQFNDPTNIFGTILDPIRNRIAFHFEHRLLEKLLGEYQFADYRVFAIGKSGAKRDSFYQGSDDLILNFIISKMPSHIKPEDRYKAFEDEVVHIAGELSNLIDSIMLDLVKPYAYFRIERS